jgi:hypothetical protein
VLATGLAVAAAALVVSMGCATPTDTTPYPGGACATLIPTLWVPAGNSLGAPTDTSIRVTFNEYPDPDTVGSNSLLLTTGFFWVPGVYGVDLLGKTAILRPWRPLSPDLAYTLHLAPALHSLEGCPAPDTTREFRTATGPAGASPPPVPAFADVQALFESRCGNGGCHLDAAVFGGGCLAAPAAGLSLCAAESWDALVGVPSRQEAGLLLVDPGNSARSYLLRKLIPAPPDAGPMPTVLGQREPPGPPLDPAEIEAVAAWIDAGAVN